MTSKKHSKKFINASPMFEMMTTVDFLVYTMFGKLF